MNVMGSTNAQDGRVGCLTPLRKLPVGDYRISSPHRCIEAASAITQRRILCTWTWGASGASSCAPTLRVGIALSKGRRQLSIVSVNVIGEMNVAVLIGECRPVHNEDRDLLHQVHGNVIFFALHSLLDFFQSPAGIIA